MKRSKIESEFGRPESVKGCGSINCYAKYFNIVPNISVTITYNTKNKYNASAIAEVIALQKEKIDTSFYNRLANK